MTYSRFVSFTRADRAGYGLMLDNGVVDLSARLSASLPTLRSAIEQDALQRLADLGASLSADFPVEDMCFALPIPDPEKVICVGVNYPDRNEEYRDDQPAPAYPSLFVRFARSFTGHRSPLIRPRESHQFDYEGEIAIVIGKAGRRIDESAAFSHIAALSLCNEATLRDWVRHGKFNVTQGKNFDRSGSIGPWLTPFLNQDQLADIRLETRVNGAVRQSDRTSRMIFSFPKLISYISTFTTLVPGDIVVTGTPTGAGARLTPPVWLQVGDIVEVEAEGIGCLCNPVADEI